MLLIAGCATSPPSDEAVTAWFNDNRAVIEDIRQLRDVYPLWKVGVRSKRMDYGQGPGYQKAVEYLEQIDAKQVTYWNKRVNLKHRGMEILYYSSNRLRTIKRISVEYSLDISGRIVQERLTYVPLPVTNWYIQTEDIEKW